MSAPLSSSLKRVQKLRINKAIAYHRSLLKLESVKKLTFKFDPFCDNVSSIRQFLQFVNLDKVKKSNSSCAFNVNVVNNRTDPEIIIQFANEDKAIFNTANLNSVDILKNFNDLCRERETNI